MNYRNAAKWAALILIPAAMFDVVRFYTGIPWPIGFFVGFAWGVGASLYADARWPLIKE